MVGGGGRLRPAQRPVAWEPEPRGNGSTSGKETLRVSGSCRPQPRGRAQTPLSVQTRGRAQGAPRGY